MNSLSNDDTIRPVNVIILRTVSIDDDGITKFNSGGSIGASITQSVISESRKSVFSKINKINVSIDSRGNDNGSRPRSSGLPTIIIGIENSSPRSTPGEKVNSQTTSTDVYESNETNMNNNFLEFVLHQISLLIDMPLNFIEFENDMK